MKALFSSLMMLFGLYVQAQFAVVGDASASVDSTFNLTNNGASSYGAVWDSTKVSLSSSFDISFDVIFKVKNPGEGGMAFVLQDDADGLSAISTAADGLGYQGGIDKSFALEVDIEDNGGANETAADHLAMHGNGDQNTIYGVPTGVYSNNRNIENFSKHRVRVLWDHRNERITVYVACNLMFTQRIDLVDDIFNGTTDVFMGFTAGNEGSGHETIVNYIGETPEATLRPDVSPTCPDTIVLGNNTDRNDFSNWKWVLETGGNRVDSFNFYEGAYEADILGDYKVHLSALRGCDSSIVVETSDVRAFDSIVAGYSFTIDTTCTGYDVQLRTTCTDCDALSWKFGNKGAAFGWPFQVLNFSLDSDFEGFIYVEAIQGNCNDKDSELVDLPILATLKPGLGFERSAFCVGDSIIVQDSSSGADSVIFKVEGANQNERVVGPRGAIFAESQGATDIIRTVYYPKGCTFTDTTSVTVAVTPTADFGLLDSTKNCGVVNYITEQRSNSFDSLVWYAEGDTIIDVEEPEIIADTNTAFNIQLVAFNGGCSDTSNLRTFPIIFYPPEVELIADTVEGCSPLKVDFSWDITGQFDSILIDTDDERDSLSTERSGEMAHTYETGIYDLQYVTYSGDSNCIDTTVLTEYIEVFDSVVAGLAINTLAGCAPLDLNLEDGSYVGDSVNITYKLSLMPVDSQPVFERIYFQNDEDTTLRTDGDYLLGFVVDNGLCSDTAAYLVTVRSLNQNDQVEPVGVTVDGENAKLYWEAMPIATSYDILRTDDFGSEQAFTVPDTFLVDEGAQVNNSSYTYTIVGVDDCGSRSNTSRPSTTILLEGEVNESVQADLSWNPYREFANGVQAYELLTDTRPAISVNGGSYLDQDFFSENSSDSGDCYRIAAYENDSVPFVSYSNEICLFPPPVLYFPNAFSPNEDGLNDTFMWKGAAIDSMNLRIFNRWGVMVFEGTNAWDGRHNDRLCTPDIYYYVATYKGINREQKFVSGEIKLVR